MKDAPHTDYRALPSERGHVILYRPAETNCCPGCGGSHWLVGRTMAECARCATAIPLMSPFIPSITTEGQY
ncbi:MAG: hypothetical protein WBL20_14370 [Sphingobium sp.]|uniref:hypothetical protein n=1 Tax=Sphingobium sp. TaxID=1912891 RepID=UPI002E239A66